MINIIEQVSEPSRIKQLDLLHDCADICGVTGQFVAANSRFKREIVKICYVICHECAQECMQFNDRKSLHCAKECIYCTNACKGYLEENQ